MDNAPWHKKTKRLVCDEKRPEYADILNCIEFIEFPAYSPELNPMSRFGELHVEKIRIIHSSLLSMLWRIWLILLLLHGVYQTNN